eukprot:1962151-Rhodomonas_salina.1
MAGGRDGAEAEALEKTTTWRGEAAVAMRLFAVGKVRGLDGGGELEALRQVDGCADLPARHLDVRHLAPETAHVREQRKKRTKELTGSACPAQHPCARTTGPLFGVTTS